MKPTNNPTTKAIRDYAAKHGYSIPTVRTTSSLFYAAIAEYEANQPARQDAYAAMDEDEQAYRDYADRFPNS
jgi:hypothetical protein